MIAIALRKLGLSDLMFHFAGQVVYMVDGKDSKAGARKLELGIALAKARKLMDKEAMDKIEGRLNEVLRTAGIEELESGFAAVESFFMGGLQEGPVLEALMRLLRAMGVDRLYQDWDQESRDAYGQYLDWQIQREVTYLLQELRPRGSEGAQQEGQQRAVERSDAELRGMAILRIMGRALAVIISDRTIFGGIIDEFKMQDREVYIYGHILSRIEASIENMFADIIGFLKRNLESFDIEFPPDDIVDMADPDNLGMRGVSCTVTKVTYNGDVYRIPIVWVRVAPGVYRAEIAFHLSNVKHKVEAEKDSKEKEDERRRAERELAKNIGDGVYNIHIYYTLPQMSGSIGLCPYSKKVGTAITNSGPRDIIMSTAHLVPMRHLELLINYLLPAIRAPRSRISRAPL